MLLSELWTQQNTTESMRRKARAHDKTLQNAGATELFSAEYARHFLNTQCHYDLLYCELGGKVLPICRTRKVDAACRNNPINDPTSTANQVYAEGTIKRRMKGFRHWPTLSSICYGPFVDEIYVKTALRKVRRICSTDAISVTRYRAAPRFTTRWCAAASLMSILEQKNGSE